MLPAPRSIVAQLLLLLVLTVILVVTAGSLFSYQSTAAANQKAVLASLQMDAERRAWEEAMGGVVVRKVPRASEHA